MKYFIRKSSRFGATTPYDGPTCEKAGVEPGKYYSQKKEAEIDADKMSKVNKVGFVVEKCEEK